MAARVVRLRTGRGYSIWARITAPRSSRRSSVIVLCHGLGVSHEYPLIETLERSFRADGYRVCVFDFAGHGASGGTIQDRLVQNFIKDIGTVIEHLRLSLGASAPIVLVGHSIGALSALLYAGTHVDPNLAIVPIAANAHAHQKYEKMRQQQKVRILKRYVLIGRSKVSKRFWNDRIHFEPKQYAERLTVPVLYLCGAEDHTNPPEESRELYRWTRTSRKAFRTIPHADHHFRPLAHQRAAATLIRLWLKRNAA